MPLQATQGLNSTESHSCPHRHLHLEHYMLEHKNLTILPNLLAPRPSSHWRQYLLEFGFTEPSWLIQHLNNFFSVFFIHSCCLSFNQWSYQADWKLAIYMGIQLCISDRLAYEQCTLSPPMSLQALRSLGNFSAILRFLVPGILFSTTHCGSKPQRQVFREFEWS